MKGNNDVTPCYFNGKDVLSQTRRLQLSAAIDVGKKHFQNKMSHREFVCRYACLVPNALLGNELSEMEEMSSGAKDAAKAALEARGGTYGGRSTQLRGA